jgi:hypothetical protein
VPETRPTSTINLREVNARADSAQHVITGFSRVIPNLADLWQQVTHSLSDIPILIGEIDRLGSELAIVRLDRANLAAAGRASLAAYRVGEPDPLLYLRDELDTQGFTASQRGRP